MLMRDDITSYELSKMPVWKVLNMFKHNHMSMQIEGNSATVRVRKLNKDHKTIIELTHHKERNFSRYEVDKNSNLAESLAWYETVNKEF